MTLRITIDVFSGRPNPVIELRGKEAAAVLERLTPGRRLKGREARVPPPTLGYRGLVIEQIEERKRRSPRKRGLPRVFRVVEGFLIGPDRVHEIADPTLEDFICGSTGPLRRLKSERNLIGFLERERRRYRKLWLKWPWPPRPWPWPPKLTCPCAPLYEPAWWNDGGSRQWSNNCYNYASNYRTDTFAQPGLAAGAMYGALTCASVRPAALKDDLIDSPAADNKCPKEGHLVALVIAPGSDFHWYRRGRNGRWTHKPGGTPVTNLDNSGVLIPDPRTADRGPYTDFCTFMTVMHGHIKIG